MRMISFMWMVTVALWSRVSSATATPTPTPTAHPTSDPTLYPTHYPTHSFTLTPSSYPTHYPTEYATQSPTHYPTHYPTAHTTEIPTAYPTHYPTQCPTAYTTKTPTHYPTHYPTAYATESPTHYPTQCPTAYATQTPTHYPTVYPTVYPSSFPSTSPTAYPTSYATDCPTAYPTVHPTQCPTVLPTSYPTVYPTTLPSAFPTMYPTFYPSSHPTANPSHSPTPYPTAYPTTLPTITPTVPPTSYPTCQPSAEPSSTPTAQPSVEPSGQPTGQPSQPSSQPTSFPTGEPSKQPSAEPSSVPSRPPSIFPVATVVEFEFSTTVDVSPDSFDEAAREAWINITASSIENMSPDSIKIISVMNYTDNSTTSNLRHRRLNSQPISEIVMSVSNIMESFGYNDADQFTSDVQTQIGAKYANPTTANDFIKLAVSKGTKKISSGSVLTIGAVKFAPTVVIRVLTGAPTSTPSSNPTSLAIKSGAGGALLSTQEAIYVSVSVVIFVLLILFLCYFFLFRRKNDLHNEKEWRNVTSDEEENLGIVLESDDDDGYYTKKEDDVSRRGTLVRKLPANETSARSKNYSRRQQPSPLADHDMDDEWIEKYSERKSKPYWVNSVTGYSTWKNPVEKKEGNKKYKETGQARPSTQQDTDPNDWIEKFSDRKLKSYWVHKSTLQSTWKNPFAGQKNSSRVYSSHMVLPNEDEEEPPSVTKSQSVAFGFNTNTVWIEKFSARKQKPYWVNSITDESTWNDPNAPTVSAQGSRTNTPIPEVGEWVEKFDQTRMKPYWKNSITRVTTWRNPSQLEPSIRTLPYERFSSLAVSREVESKTGEWIEKFSVRKQTRYWVNSETKISTWRDPNAQLDTTSSRIITPAAEDTWIEKMDKTRMKPYWKNTRTQAISLQNPTSF